MITLGLNYMFKFNLIHSSSIFGWKKCTFIDLQLLNYLICTYIHIYAYTTFAYISSSVSLLFTFNSVILIEEFNRTFLCNLSLFYFPYLEYNSTSNKFTLCLPEIFQFHIQFIRVASLNVDFIISYLLYSVILHSNVNWVP